MGRILNHFLPLRNPANGACQGKQNCEHAGGEAQGTQDDAGIEIDIWIEFAFNEVRIAKRNTFKFTRNIKLWIILDAKRFEHFMS